MAGYRIEDTSNGFVIRPPCWLYLTPAMLIWGSMTTKASIDSIRGVVTVTRGYVPLFLWRARNKEFSPLEARTASVRSVEEPSYDISPGRTRYDVVVRTHGGGQVWIFRTWKRDEAENVASRLVDLGTRWFSGSRRRID